MRLGPGRRAALGLCALAAPVVWAAVHLLPPHEAASASVLVLVAAAWLLGRAVDARLKELTEVVRRLAAGDFTARAPAVEGGLDEELNRLAERTGGELAELTGEKARLEAVLAQMTEGVAAVDAGGLVLVVNPALSRLLGVDAGAARGRPYLESLRHKGVSELLAAVLKDRRPISQEIRLVAGREELVFDAHAAPLTRADRPAGALVVLHDITRLRRLEAVRRDFVANVGHELRTPLASIKGFAETLREGALNDKEHAPEFVRTIETHADRLSKLVDDLLDLSAIESGHRAPRLEPVALGPLCAEVARELAPQAEAAGVTVRVAPMEGLPPARADREHLRQIVANLVDNALKYNERGGSVEVSGEDLGGRVRLTVRDTGVGIPEGDLPRVFERFYRVDKARSREAGGTGLGLSIVKHLTEAQGGEVSVESRQPGGSAFRVTLPAA
ncbi:MAG: PAS domain-containing protein [Elusimicrobia bacterium]|nr:PAS domain-containing protein [Elusimicrobiota bacterium]